MCSSFPVLLLAGGLVLIFTAPAPGQADRPGRCRVGGTLTAPASYLECGLRYFSNLVEANHSRVHSANGTLTATTRPTFSISVRYFQRRAGTGDRGWGINVNHSESSSNSHQPQAYPSRVRRKKIGEVDGTICRILA
jgi:hypothetical protein